MASETQILSGGVSVYYSIDPSGKPFIKALSDAGVVLGTGLGTARYGEDNTEQGLIAKAIAQVNRALDNTIENARFDISVAEEELTYYQAILNDPTSSAQAKSNAKVNINGNQRNIASANQTITDCNVAKAGINSRGNSILTGLIPKQVAPTPPPTMAPTPAPTTAPAKAKLAGAADGDSGAKQANPAGTTGSPPNAATAAGAKAGAAASGKLPTKSNVSAPTGPSTPPNAKTAAAGAKAGAATATPKSAEGRSNEAKTGSAPAPAPPAPQAIDSAPGRRLKNPLGEFSSYTYQLSLYIISPDAYDMFVKSGRQDINVFNDSTKGTGTKGGAFLVAQSGGINNTTTKRADGFQFDYYIDSLELHSMVGGPASQSAANITQPINFKIIEPYGFSFITNLTKATTKLQALTAGTQYEVPGDPMKQFFILGVRFFGYDISGRPMSGQSKFGEDVLDPNATDGGLFENFYDITIVSMDLKIDGKATVYSIVAAPMAPSVAYGTKKGMTHTPYTVTANTVGEALDQLMDKITKNQKDLQGKVISKASTYKIDWSAPGADKIRDATIVSDADLDKSKWSGSGATTTEKVAADKEVKSSPKPDYRTITFSADTTILMAIQQVILKSSYLENALKVVATTALESDPKSKSFNNIKPDTNQKISWYNCSTAVSNARWDGTVADWAYDITYKIQKYETPIVSSPLTNPGVDYYGPHKRYSYWYTGKNSEVLQYELNLNNTYFNAVSGLPSDPSTGTGGNSPSGSSTAPANGASGASQNNSPSISKAPGIMSNQNRQGTTGNGSEAQNSYVTSLYDPVSAVDATIKIMGDPDFLVQESESTAGDVYDRFYGKNGFTINPNGGQVFIELEFFEAVDYTTDGDLGNKTGGGTLKINESILLWKYPKSVENIVQGINYMVNEITSTFQNGSFTQVLTVKVNEFSQAGEDTTDSSRPAQPATNPPAGASPSNSAVAKGSTGTVQNKNFDSSQPKLSPTDTSNKTPNQPTSKTGPAAKPVADDDGSKG